MMDSRIIKSALGRAVYFSGLYRLLFRNKAVVAVFHRVNDQIPANPITCKKDEFERYCRLFKRYFNVIPFSELLSRLETGQSVSHCLSITFDDGYLDNFEVALPLLRQYDLPACFFIATDFIGTDRIPWWDKQWGVQSQWMSWEQVRQIHKLGYEIGAHTKNHVDLGVLQGEEALSEIQGSRLALEEKLGCPIDLFSFPFGRESQLSEENRAMLKELGFRCSPSAYGGVVGPGCDLFRMKRQPISPWHLSEWQFGFEILQETP